ncbi:hypothetical protein [Marivita sp. GX14005]|uniref:hypothetical protein n=1 Tax=Marivita sp. GX14005 TaxID=2942276 RepID=UPI00201A14D3|nr:hypothetical protein [Marivita sp. GX14005]MCL3880773.1 hypothetical protein [Marivita sp. GX14005]
MTLPTRLCLLCVLAASPVLGQDNIAQITQEAGGNITTLDQSRAAGGEVAIEQIGSDNSADIADQGANSLLLVEQRGAEQSALVRLSGDGNEGDLVQDGLGNRADLAITGTVNSFRIDQRASDSDPARSGNRLTLSQTGIGNIAFTTQDGSENRMTLRQTGDDNFADMSQDGRANLMELEQNGPGNTAELKQIGIAAAPIIVTQTGGMSVQITQTGE